ncbi:50S ribosomal protein L32 [bacterium]|jgi:large subunit ribosomal protein L32|nr:50S ribosomal protein L32 [Planctomycetota bacterium]MDB4426480.1 50S ribosomal protein L32 [bacterium]MDB4538636.1 50S ribosomal protein L32 [bacterium]MDB4724719.1 50S ribosomal protein L32 [Planctomycetota bacterium]MDB4736394.1 50S ribosomal protein L32 [Planctomycetota bacterium]
MAHPKRRTSKSAKNKRRSHLSLNAPQAHHCPRSGVLTRSHRMSEDATHYGFEKGGQKGREVFQKDDSDF